MKRARVRKRGNVIKKIHQLFYLERGHSRIGRPVLNGWSQATYLAPLYLIFLLGKKIRQWDHLPHKLVMRMKGVNVLKVPHNWTPLVLYKESLNDSSYHHYEHHHLPTLTDLFIRFRGKPFLIQRTHKILKLKDIFTDQLNQCLILC